MDPKSIPVVCTLGKKQATTQLNEWADLQRHIVSSERITDGVAIRLAGADESEVRDLIAREGQCCAFLTFELRPADTPDETVLEVRSPNPDGLAIVEMLTGT